ncbi:unnamed protein product [Heligmosomoides polygyrus]|uniref:ZP domain-containing protein n=1 Tax=Heligmosomoides polygyrus TaxID=6339 RepID=A0A183G4F5_HELPZ|nr:unnamed protein product [Heligmosomoides polygyrus]
MALWTCESDNATQYCMTVHSCTADDGQGSGQQLIDDKGCSLDSFLLDNLEYGSDMMVGQKAHVFKFADKPTIFFSCLIRLEFKEDTSSKCNVGEDGGVNVVDNIMSGDDKDNYYHFRKAREASRFAFDMDVAAPSVEVIELPDYGM